MRQRLTVRPAAVLSAARSCDDEFLNPIRANALKIIKLNKIKFISRHNRALKIIHGAMCMLAVLVVMMSWRCNSETHFT